MKYLTWAAAFSLLASPVFASQCPSDIAAIDEAIAAGTELSEEDLARVQELRDEGQELHDAGEHDASVETLAQAKEMLGIE
ncbi:hypothetical protein [Cribrihabitans neustonicus]|uniref:hypothetical protein n=1 Tax=Cribrihabitans neustonicus TaxID=1429085 RepID=UPI003B590857